MAPRTLLRIVFLLGLLLPLSSQAQQPPPAATPAATVHLVILHLNDTHGNLSPTPTADGRSTGGIARLASCVKTIRAENPDHVLLLHAGDIISRGDPLTTAFGGEVNFKGLERLGCDALTPGNGDFYYGLDNLRRLRDLVKFPVLHGNVLARADHQAPFPATTVKEIAGIRIGILSVGRVNLDHPSARELEYLDPLVTAKALIPELQKQADVIVALTHIGLVADMQLAAEAPQLALIVGGDSHSQLSVPVRVPGSPAVVVQAGESGRFLGRVDLTVTKDETGCHVSACEGRLLPLDATVKEDPDMVAFLKPYQEKLTVVAGSLPAALGNPPKGLSPMGAYAATALREGAGAEVALLDRGAICTALPAGKVTREQLCYLHPWHNRVLLVTLTGSQLQQTIETMDPLTAGCEYQRAEDGKLSALTVAGKPLAPAATVSAAVGEYLYGTSPTLRALPARDTNERVDTLLEKRLSRNP